MWSRAVSRIRSVVSATVRVEGIGLHTGKPVTAAIRGAEPGTGIWFRRTDLPDKPSVRAHWSNVVAVDRATCLGAEGRVLVSTVEHAMAALAGLDIDDAVVDVDGPEMPIMDGSSGPFVDAILGVGVSIVQKPRRFLKVLRSVRVVRDDGAWAEFKPSESRRVSVEIFFPGTDIGRQTGTFAVDPQSFMQEMAAARTFGFVEEIDRHRQAGLCLGAGLHNAVALRQGKVINPEGLRWPDEFARHKALDAVGDLALAGLPVIGDFRAVKPGHGLHRLLLEKLASEAGAAIEVDASGPIRECGAASG